MGSDRATQVGRDASERDGHPSASRPGRTTPVSAASAASLGRVLRRAAIGAAGGEAPPGMGTALEALGSGVSVPNRALRSLSDGLGVPLDGVRLHAGRGEAELADQVSARAFTVGQDIVLGAGAGDPDSPAGYHLLAHEVVHTLQPGSGGSALTVGPADSPAEREAEALATQLTAQRFGTAATASIGVGAVTPTGAGASRTLRRFGRQEHQDLGDATGEMIDLGGGMVLSWGQVVGLAGDEFGSVNDLRAMAINDPAQLRRILTSDAVHSPDYVTLAMNNVTHFAGGGTAIPSWEEHHREALTAAVLAGVHDSYPEMQDALLVEAFGQHYLTDSFSAGHVRTPRAEIMAWYSDDFAPRALPPFIDRMRTRLRDGITAQLAGQLVLPEFAIRRLVDTVMGGALAYFDDEIRTRFQPLFGLGISGPVSGVLHDRDNERGLWVSSEAHPEEWLAYGDGRLVCSPTSAEQAKIAVVAAHDEVVRARTLGDQRREATALRPIPLTPFAAPDVVHFAFDSAEVVGPTATALDQVADFLVARPELVVDITGHTDPLGTDPYNDGLGMRRAEGVAGYLMSRGISPTRLHTASAGEHQLISAERSGFASDRRAQLDFRADSAAPDDLDWAQQVLAEQFPGPPYPTIEKYLPHEVPGRNDPQEDWHWGTMTSQMAAELDSWIAHYVGAYKATVATDTRLDDRVIPVPDLDPFGGALPVTVREATIQPRPLVTAVLDDLIARPTGFVGDLVGIPAANRSVPPLPPPVACP